MGASRAFIVGLLMLPVATLAGCLSFPADPCGGPTETDPYKRRVHQHAGLGEPTLRMEPDVLTPGSNLTFTVEFVNPDCRPFDVFGQSGEACYELRVEVGDYPLSVRGHGPSMPFNRIWFGPSGPIPGVNGIDPGERCEAAPRWDGSFRFWDFAAVWGGGDWARKTYYAAPGMWPVRFGFDSSTSYPALKNASVEIAETPLNRGSALRPGACSNIGSLDNKTLRDPTLRVEPLQALIGNPVEFELRFTLHLPRTGCVLFSGFPTLIASGTGSSWIHTFTPECRSQTYPSDAYFHAQEATLEVVQRWTWDGGSGSGAKCADAAAPGEARIEFESNFGSGSSKASARWNWLA